MSIIDLHEFNILSKKHKYFFTNNGANRLPCLSENSYLLKKLILNRTAKSTEKSAKKNNEKS